MIVTKTAIPRRTVLRGVGATLALPLLDGMLPAATALANCNSSWTRLASRRHWRRATRNKHKNG